MPDVIRQRKESRPGTRSELADRASAKLLELLERRVRGRELFLLLVGRQARGRAWPNAAEPVLDYGCLEASKDAAIAASRVPLDVVVEDVHQYGGGVAMKLDRDLIGVHPREPILRYDVALQVRQVRMRQVLLPEPRRQAGPVPRPPATPEAIG